MEMQRLSRRCSKTRVHCARSSTGWKRNGWRDKPSWKADGARSSGCIVAAAAARPAAAKKLEGGAMSRISTAVAVVALLALSSGAPAQIPPLASIGTAHEKVLAELLDKNQPDDAARYWGENRSYFWDNAEQHKALLARLKTAVNTPHEARMNEAIELLKPFSAQSLPLAEWANVIRVVSAARMALETYRALPIAIDDSLRSERFIALDGALSEVTQVYVSNAPAAFAQYDHFGMPLFTRTYPVEVPDEVIGAGYLALKPRFETANAAEIAKFSEGYAKILTGKQREELARFAMQARYREMVPGGKLTAEAAAKLIAEMSAGRLDPATLPVRFGFYWSQDAAKSGEVPLALKPPANISVRELSRRELAGRFAEADVAVFIDVDKPLLNRNTRSTRREYSRFKSSERQALNPP